MIEVRKSEPLHWRLIRPLLCAIGVCGGSVVHDGFNGQVIGYYFTREGKPGLVLQQNGTKVVHVYGEKWFIRDQELR